MLLKWSTLLLDIIVELLLWQISSVKSLTRWFTTVKNTSSKDLFLKKKNNLLMVMKTLKKTTKNTEVMNLQNKWLFGTENLMNLSPFFNLVSNLTKAIKNNTGSLRTRYKTFHVETTLTSVRLKSSGNLISLKEESSNLSKSLRPNNNLMLFKNTT